MAPRMRRRITSAKREEIEKEQEQLAKSIVRPFDVIGGLPVSYNTPPYGHYEDVLKNPLTVKDSGILYRSLMKSRNNYINWGPMFRLYWLKQSSYTKRMLSENRATKTEHERPTILAADVNARDVMVKLCDAGMSLGPHTFEIRMFIAKDERSDKPSKEDESDLKTVKKEERNELQSELTENQELGDVPPIQQDMSDPNAEIGTEESNPNNGSQEELQINGKNVEDTSNNLANSDKVPQVPSTESTPDPTHQNLGATQKSPAPSQENPVGTPNQMIAPGISESGTPESDLVSEGPTMDRIPSEGVSNTNLPQIITASQGSTSTDPVEQNPGIASDSSRPQSGLELGTSTPQGTNTTPRPFGDRPPGSTTPMFGRPANTKPSGHGLFPYGSYTSQVKPQTDFSSAFSKQQELQRQASAQPDFKSTTKKTKYNLDSPENLQIIKNLNSLARLDPELRKLMEEIATGEAPREKLMTFQGFTARAKEMGPPPHPYLSPNFRINPNVPFKLKSLLKERKYSKLSKNLKEKDQRLTAFQERYLTNATLLFEFVENPNVRYLFPSNSICEVLPAKTSSDERNLLVSFIWIHNSEEVESYEAELKKYHEAVEQREKKEKEEEEKRLEEEGKQKAEEEKQRQIEEDKTLDTSKEEDSLPASSRTRRRPPPASLAAPSKAKKTKKNSAPKKLIPPDEPEVRFTPVTFQLHEIPVKFVPIITNSFKPPDEVRNYMKSIIDKGIRSSSLNLWYQVDGKLDEELAENIRSELIQEEKKMTGFITSTTNATKKRKV